jgi:hypothetical protein
MRRVVTLSMMVEQRRALWLHCEKCFHAAKMAIPDPIERHGDLELQVVLERAICTRCGARWPDCHAAGAAGRSASDQIQVAISAHRSAKWACDRSSRISVR